MRASDIAGALQFDASNISSAFSTLKIVSQYVMEHGASDKVALDAIIRLRDLSERGIIADAGLNDAIFSLCREAGLFPYMPESKLEWRDRLALEFYRGPAEVKYVFHKEQWLAFQHLILGKSLVLSAPTSFGKSVLIHAFIAQKKPRCVVIIVPTIALLDQFRKRLTDYFGSEYQIITRNDQQSDAGKRRIFVLTQERLLDRNDIIDVDLLAIDEYYKLDTGREQGEINRTVLLNVALRQYMDIAKQIFFLGPTVAAVEMRDEIRSRFVQHSSDFSTVAVDIHDHSNSESPYRTIAELLQTYRDDKSLIFSKSPPAARILVKEISAQSAQPVSAVIEKFTNWLSENYHPEWSLVSALRAGYGIHHGSIPRSVAQALVRFFNEGDLNALICTSTLIEGVNTAAKNVFIFDKKISNSNFDYFDFRNIAGRSGRMGHHFVGRIFLFHEPPSPTAFQLEIPALNDESKLSDAVLVNLSDELLGATALSRKRTVLSRSTLPEDLIKQLAPYGLTGAENLSNYIRGLLEDGDYRLIWTGRVSYPELLSVFSLAWEYLKFNKGRLSAREAAFYANRLKNARTLREFFDGLTAGKDEKGRAESLENGFRALVAFDYAIPKVLIDMESLVNHHCLEMRLGLANYSYMAQALDNCFSHHWVKALDEYGIPIPLGKKLSFIVEDAFTLEDAINNVRSFVASRLPDENFSDLELEIIRTAVE